VAPGRRGCRRRAQIHLAAGTYISQERISATSDDSRVSETRAPHPPGRLGWNPTSRKAQRRGSWHDRSVTQPQESLQTASPKRGLAALTLVRHGESEGNLADRAALEAREPRLDLDLRDADVPLSETGVQQARAV